MQLILQGSLKRFPLAQLLEFLAAHGHGGTLDVEAKPKRARIFMRDGKVIGAEAAGLDGIEEVVVDACMWQSGNFTMLDEVVLPEGAPAREVAIAPLLVEIARRLKEQESFDDAVMFRVVENSSQDQISLTPDDFRLLIRVGLGRTFGELAADKDRVELTKALRRLEESGLVTRPGGEPPKPAVADETKIVSREVPKPGPPKEAPKTEPQPEPEAPAATPSKRTAGNQLIASLTADGESGPAFALVESEQTIGRDASNEIPVVDGSVSTRHARITRTPAGFFIEDLGSRNGTFVNGEKVKEKRQLADNDLIRFGKMIFTFNVATEVKKVDTTTGGTRVE